MTVGATERLYGAFDEDALLAKRFLAGEREAFDGIYKRYYERVYVLAKGILLDADDAADAVQETFALIFRNLRRFRRQSKLGTWIFRIAVNTAIQHSRRLKYRRRVVPLSEADDRPAPDAEPALAGGRVERAMGDLNPADRAILTLFYWEDLSLAEIGDALGCGANAAKTRLYRARERFREIYESLEEQA